MLFLVDGYNVTMADPATRALGKEGMRDDLVARLSAGAAGILGRGRVMVVFDARDQLSACSETVGSIRVVYAPDADTEIVRLAEKAAEQVVVVSNDMRLRARVSQDVSRRVEYRDASVCFAGARRDTRTRSRDAAHGAGAPDAEEPAGADDITSELTKLWLPEERD